MNIAPITKPTVDESYEAATNSTNMKVVADKRGDGDMMVAAGWSDCTLGLALMRLRSEWAGATHPVPVTAAVVKAMVTEKVTRAQAQAEVDSWYQNELHLLLIRLKSLKHVRHEMTLRAYRNNINPENVGPVMLWWLDQNCKHCHGKGKRPIPGTPALSIHNCQHCAGTGKSTVPRGKTGQYLAGVMDYSVTSAKRSLSKRFVHQQPRS